MKILFLLIFILPTVTYCKTPSKVVRVTDTIIIRDTISVYGTKVLIHKEAPASSTFKDILPFITLILGFFINRAYDWFESHKKIKKIGERWQIEISSLSESINNYNTSLEEYLKRLDSKENDIPELSMNVHLRCDVFDLLDKVELVQYFRKIKCRTFEESAKNSNGIIGFIEVQKSQFSNLKSKFEEFLNEVHKQNDLLSFNLQALMKEFANYQVELEKEAKTQETGVSIDSHPDFAPILKLFESEIMPYMDKGDFSIDKLETNFFQPLINCLSNVRHKPYVKSFAEEASKGPNIIKKIWIEKEYLKANIKTIHSRYKEQLVDIERVKAYFEDKGHN